jgi:hypothetical protein
MIAWCVLSLASTTGEGFRGQWTRSADLLRASAWVRTREDLCGLGIYGIGWWETGGYSHLHRRVPIQLPADERELAEVLPEANYLFVPATETGKVQDYETLACWSATCVLGRGGICTSEGKFAVNEVLRTRGD